MRPLDIQINDSVYDPRSSENIVEYKSPSDGTTLYKVYLFLVGRDLPYVQNVTYHLHSTFRNRNRLIKRTAANPNCMLELWLWGMFEIKATVELKSHPKITLTHQLAFDRELVNLPESSYKLAT